MPITALQSSHVLFSLTKGIQFTNIHDKERQQILLFEKLEPENVLHLFTVFA